MTGSARRPMVPGDLFRIRFVSDPQFHPDGRRIAFVVTTLSEERDEYLSTIWVVDVDGGEVRPFTRGPRRDTAPRWSPDGRWLAFVSERERKAKGQLHVMPADGGEPLRLTDLRHGVSSPAWSPDGTRLAFVARVGGWEEPKDEEERARSKPPRVIDVLKYRSNGTGFIYDRPRQVFVVGTDGGPARQLTDGPFDHQYPAWSPDGRWVAFASARHADRDEDSAADVWIVPAEGGEPRRLTSTAGPASWPSFSPDGRTVAYLGHPHPRDVSRHHRVWTVPVAGGPPVCLTAALDRNCEPMMGAVGPQWLSSTGMLLFQVEDSGDVPLYEVSATGGAPPERRIGGTRQVTAFSASGDGAQIAFTATDDLSPPEVFVCRADGSGERQLTDLNREWKAEVLLARPERFRFERAGYTVDGWVMPPVGREADRRYASLLQVHGGPASQYGHRFFDEFQVYAGAGYGVVYLNPRGSRGYSEAFARAVVGDWGGGDYADMMAGLDEALRRYDFLDPGTPRGDGRELRRLHDELDRRPHRPLPGRVLGARRQRALEHVRDQRHRSRVPGSPRRGPPALGRPQVVPRALASLLRAGHPHPAPHHPLRGRSPVSDGAGGAALRRLEEAPAPGALRPVPGRGSRALALRPAAAPARAVPDSAGVVSGAPAPGPVLIDVLPRLPGRDPRARP